MDSEDDDEARDDITKSIWAFDEGCCRECSTSSEQVIRWNAI